MKKQTICLVCSALVCALCTTAPAQVAISITPTKQSQTIEGFGGFGPQKVWWSGANATYYTDQWLDLVINDLGLTMLRDVPPSTIEEPNDNADPANLDISKFNLTNLPYGDATFAMHLPFLKAIKEKADASGEPFMLLASWWSPPAWMKVRGITKGDEASSLTQPFDTIKTSAYDEYAEMVAGYCKIIKRDCGYYPYAISPQDEPAFTEPYESCQWTHKGLAKVTRLISERLAKEGIPTKVVIPEELSSQWMSLRAYMTIAGDDPTVRGKVHAAAYHAYSDDGIGGTILDSAFCKAFGNLCDKYGWKAWQTETSGYANGWMNHAQNILYALKYSRLTTWIYWYLSDDFIASNGSNVRTKFWYSSKNFFRYIRPGAVMMDVSASDLSLPAVAFGHPDKKTLTIVVVNNGGTDKTGTITCPGAPANFRQYRTSSTEDCLDKGVVASGATITFPAGSVTTLYATGWTMPAAVVGVSHPQTVLKAAGSPARVSGGEKLYSLKGARLDGVSATRIVVRKGSAGVSLVRPGR